MEKYIPSLLQKILNNILQLLCEETNQQTKLSSDLEHPIHLWKHHHQKAEDCKPFLKCQVLMVAVTLQV